MIMLNGHALLLYVIVYLWIIGAIVVREGFFKSSTKTTAFEKLLIIRWPIFITVNLVREIVSRLWRGL